MTTSRTRHKHPVTTTGASRTRAVTFVGLKHLLVASGWQPTVYPVVADVTKEVVYL